MFQGKKGDFPGGGGSEGQINLDFFLLVVVFPLRTSPIKGGATESLQGKTPKVADHTERYVPPRPDCWFFQSL